MSTCARCGVEFEHPFYKNVCPKCIIRKEEPPFIPSEERINKLKKKFKKKGIKKRIREKSCDYSDKIGGIKSVRSYHHNGMTIYLP